LPADAPTGFAARRKVAISAHDGEPPRGRADGIALAPIMTRASRGERAIDAQTARGFGTETVSWRSTLPCLDRPRTPLQNSPMPGKLFIVTAPSGAGKSTLIAKLLEEDKRIFLSVSYTTRAPRPGEVDGSSYHFVDKATFARMLEQGEFLESAEVHGNHYGTSERWIREQRAAGHDILLEIDWQGAQQVRRVFDDTVGIFILPPSLAELERRMRLRGLDSEEVVRRRLAVAADEMSHASEFDYVIINKDFEEARRDLAAVVRASRLVYSLQLERNPQVFKS
jgi:guanylate kinase